MKRGVTGPGAPFRRENGDEDFLISRNDRVIHQVRIPDRQADQPDRGEVPGLEVVAAEVQVRDSRVVLVVVDSKTLHRRPQQVLLDVLPLLGGEQAAVSHQVVRLGERGEPHGLVK